MKSGAPRRARRRLTAVAALAASLCLLPSNTASGAWHSARAGAGAPQKKEHKQGTLPWTPPDTDAPLPVLDTAAPCSPPGVLEQAGTRAVELVTSLRNFDARESIQYEELDSMEMPTLSIPGTFDYVVDFTERPGVLSARESRKPLAGSDSFPSDIQDAGLAALALIFHPVYQADYEFRCEGAAEWNSQRAWVIHFQQAKNKKPRTLAIMTSDSSYPVRLKGRAWIASDSGQILHIETNLMEGIGMLHLRGGATAIDYEPVQFHSQNISLWLPQSVTAYSDYGDRRTIMQHTFSNFLLFSTHVE